MRLATAGTLQGIVIHGQRSSGVIGCELAAAIAQKTTLWVGQVGFGARHQQRMGVGGDFV